MNTKAFSALFRNDRIKWQDQYRKLYKIHIDPFSVHMPHTDSSFPRMILVSKKITVQKVLSVMSRLCTVIEYPRNICAAVEPPSCDYYIFIRNIQEADEPTAIATDSNESERAESIVASKVLLWPSRPGVTLLERLLAGVDFYLSTGKHLDEENISVCTGDLINEEFVPTVRTIKRVNRTYLVISSIRTTQYSLRHNVRGIYPTYRG